MNVYCITNKINGKKYIGITNFEIEKRFKNHIIESRSKSTRTICKAIRKYGKENFEISLIEQCSSEEELKNREIYWIEQYKTLTEGYNDTAGGDGSTRRKMSEETRKKISESKKKFYKDNPDFCKIISEKTKEGMAALKNEMGEESFRQMIIKNRGPVSEETRQKISKAGKGLKRSKETRQKISEAKKGRIVSEETIEKWKNTMKEKNLIRYGENNPMANPESRKKVGLSKIGRKRVYKEDGSFTYEFPKD